MKKYTFWMGLSVFFLLITACLHSLSFINQPQPANDTERQMIDLMQNYHMEMGAGFSPSMLMLFNSVSACLTLLCLFGGLLNWYLLRKKAPPALLKGVLGIEVLIFGACFVTCFFLSFLPPVVCTGLIFGSILLSWITCPAD